MPKAPKPTDPFRSCRFTAMAKKNMPREKTLEGQKPWPASTPIPFDEGLNRDEDGIFWIWETQPWPKQLMWLVLGGYIRVRVPPRGLNPLTPRHKQGSKKRPIPQAPRGGHDQRIPTNQAAQVPQSAPGPSTQSNIQSSQQYPLPQFTGAIANNGLGGFQTAPHRVARYDNMAGAQTQFRSFIPQGYCYGIDSEPPSFNQILQDQITASDPMANWSGFLQEPGFHHEDPIFDQALRDILSGIPQDLSSYPEDPILEQAIQDQLNTHSPVDTSSVIPQHSSFYSNRETLPSSSHATFSADEAPSDHYIDFSPPVNWSGYIGPTLFDMTECPPSQR